MAQICTNIQEKYVPCNKDEGEVYERVIFDGDQLTEERARNAEWANILAENEVERLEGLEVSFADWHLKKNLYQVCTQTYIEHVLLTYFYLCTIVSICVLNISFFLFIKFFCSTRPHERKILEVRKLGISEDVQAVANCQLYHINALKILKIIF